MAGKIVSDSETPLSAGVRWLNLRRADDMCPADESEFKDWLARDPENYRLYQRLENQWLIMGSVAQDPRILATRKQDRENFRARSGWRKLSAIAAILFLMITSGWGVYNAGLLEGIIGYGSQSARIVQSDVGQRRVMTLADGSVVTLDTSSEIQVLDMQNSRSLRLVKGRAFFDVAKDPSRPFIVKAGDKTVEAIGTSFSVRMDQDQVIVALLEGKVHVEQKGSTARTPRRVDLVVGQQLIARKDAQWKVQKIDIPREASWMAGRLVFLDESLVDAIKEMNRYSERKLMFAGDVSPSQRIVGVFEAGDVDAFVKAIELNGFAKVTSQSEDKIVLVATDMN